MSRQSRKYLGVAQLGSALEWGSRGRKFKSSHPDHARAQRKRCALRFVGGEKKMSTRYAPVLAPLPIPCPFRTLSPPRSFVAYPSSRLTHYHVSLALSLFRRYAPYKSSHPDQSVADLTRPRRFHKESIAYSFRRSALCRCAKMQAAPPLLVFALRFKTIAACAHFCSRLFGAF